MIAGAALLALVNLAFIWISPLVLRLCKIERADASKVIYVIAWAEAPVLALANMLMSTQT